jgi:hypothetical protein
LTRNLLSAELSSLHFANTALSPPDLPLSFSHLRTLTLNSVSFSTSTALKLFQPSTLPFLQVFVFTAAGNSSHSTHRKLATEISSELLARLSTLQLHAEDEPLFTLDFVPPSVPLLLTVTRDTNLHLPSLPTHHRRYFIGYLFAEEVQRIQQSIEISPPLSLHLSPDLRRTMYTSTAVENSVAALLRWCEAKGVEVVWYDPDEEEQYALSPSFQRYVKRLKADEQAVATMSKSSE